MLMLQHELYQSKNWSWPMKMRLLYNYLISKSMLASKALYPLVGGATPGTLTWPPSNNLFVGAISL